MNRLEIGLEKAYRGWDIPAYLYDRNGQIMTAGQSERLQLPEGLFSELLSYYDQWKQPVIYTDGQTIIYMLFEFLEYLVVMGPVAVRRMREEEKKTYIFQRLRTEENISIPYVPLRKAASCLSTISYLVNDKYYKEEDILKLGKRREEDIQENVARDLFYVEDGDDEERYQYDFEQKWVEQIEKGEMQFPEMEVAQIYENLYRVGTLSSTGDKKQGEYMMVSALTLASRAAIRGGVDPYQIYQISDVYLQKLSACENLFEIGKVGVEAIGLFNSMVKQHLESSGNNIYCEKAKNYIGRHIREKIRVQDIADNVGLSSSYLSSLFVKEEGISIKQYMIQERLTMAANLLRNTDESIGTISDYLAFNSQSYFTSHFREQFGMTPTEYRQRNGNFTV